MWRQTLARVVLHLLCAEYSVVMCGAWPGNLSDLTVASSQYDILLCCETLVSDMRHVSEVLVPGFCPPVLCLGKMPRARRMAAYVRDGYGAFRQPKFECGCCEMLFLGFVVRDRTFMCTVFSATLT